MYSDRSDQWGCTPDKKIIDEEKFEEWWNRKYRTVLYSPNEYARDAWLESHKRQEEKIQEYRSENEQLRQNYNNMCDKFNRQNAKVEKWKERIDALEKKYKFTYCAYCGLEFEVDAPDSTVAVDEHIKTCKQHPLVQRIERLKERIKELENVIDSKRRGEGAWSYYDDRLFMVRDKKLLEEV